MNTEEIIKQKKIELSSFLENFNVMAKMLNSHKEETIKELEAEIASLSKPEEPQPLTFLELAFKYEKDLWRELDGINKALLYGQTVTGVYAYSNHKYCGIPLTQARKFVAEIYLTLLAKELNGNTDVGYHSYTQKLTPAFDHKNDCIKLVVTDRIEYNSLLFAHDVLNKALNYSPEAATMWNWLFGRGQGK